METNTSRLINLNGSNYQLWKTRMEDYLYVNGFHQPMICSEKPDNKTNEEWKLLNRQVCGFIRHWVDDNILTHVNQETNARSLLSKLEQLYALKTLNSAAADGVMSVELVKNNVMIEETRRKSQNYEHVNKKRTFQATQKPLQVGTVQCRYPNDPSFLQHEYNRQVVRFRSLEFPKDEFSLELSVLENYDAVVERVAARLNLDDPSKIRLTVTLPKCHGKQSIPQQIKYRGFEHVSDILAHKNKTTDILYFEVLDIPLPELQGLKTLKVAFHHSTKDEVVIHTIRLPKQSTVGDVINDLKTKVELSHKDAELRLLEIYFHKINKIFTLNEKIENVNDQPLTLRAEEHTALRAEEIPEDEKDLDSQHHLIRVNHFTKNASWFQQVQNFGEPFLLVIREGETLAEVKIRIQKKLRVPDEEFSKWKFASLSLGQPTYIQDSDVVYNSFQRKDFYGLWEQRYLGLEHSDTKSNGHKPQISDTTVLP